MNAFRVARAARPAFNALRTVQRRGYADVAADKIQLSLALPHQVRLRRKDYRSLWEIGEMRRWRVEGNGRKRWDEWRKMPESEERQESSWRRRYEETVGG